MSALKMFFCIVSETRADEISVHRELNSIYTLWSAEKSDNKIGIIHIGFIRPKIPSYEEIQHFHGRILVSASVKWSLPAEYITSSKVVSESNNLRFFQLLTGFGFNIEIAEDDYKSDDICVESPVKSNSNHTISSAAIEVLEAIGKPMSKEEIYGHIVERNLFHFGAKKPVNVLNVELNRHCEGTEYSQPSSTKLFGINNAGLFFALSCSNIEFADWLKVLPLAHPELASRCSEKLIFDDDSYLENRQGLLEKFQRELDLIRFNQLKNQINIEDLSKLLPILPACILDAHISQLGLSVRTSNVFSVQNIFTLKNAIGYSMVDMMKWPNFGRKSVIGLSDALIYNVERLSFQLPTNTPINETEDNILDTTEEKISIDTALEYVSKVPLKELFENSLSLLKDNARLVLEYRTGYKEPVKTLEEVGNIIGVSRERIRQIQKKNIEKTITTEYWDDCIAIKIGELLLNRKQPLYLEMLEIEDDWFAGFIGNYQHLAAIIELFTENEIRLIKIDGAIAVTRISQEDWDNMLLNFRKSLRQKANEHVWTRYDIELTLKASLDEKGATELFPLLWMTFSEMMIFEEHSPGEEILISYGKTLNSATLAVLHQAESPLHFSLIAERVCQQFGKTVTDSQVNSCLHKVGAKLFDRGIYGLPHFNPISESTCEHLRVVVETITYSSQLMKQWHTTEFMTLLEGKFPALPKELNQYILNMILESSKKLTYLNKNVWARADSVQSSRDRVDMADAFTKILEDSGRPLKGVEIKEKLKEIRGVPENLQLQPSERMILVGPDTWGLIERDIGGAEDSNKQKLDAIFSYLSGSQKGIHVSEVSECLASYNFDPNETTSYALLNLAQRDERFFLGRAMFLGLSDWGEDVRRLNYSQAVRKILEDMCRPMSISEINAQVEILTGLDVDSSVTGLLINQGGQYNSSTRLWGKVLSPS
jgi:hypothetical protein